jgi:glycosyltransferase involved in cell wall biosynthesis
MKIFFLVRSLRQDGAGSHQNALSYIRDLKERGHEVDVHAVTSFNNPPPNITVTAHAKEKLGFVAGNKFITDVLSAHEKNTDLFFLYGVDCVWGGGEYRKRGGTKPVVVCFDTCLSTMQGGGSISRLYYLKRLFWEKLIGMFVAAHVDAYIAVSPFIQDTYVRSGFSANKFYVVPNLFERYAASSVPETHRRNTIEFLYAGRLTDDKGVDLLIAAAKDLPREPKWHLRIVGDGALSQQCAQTIRDHKLENFISITPWVTVETLQDIYKESDIFVHPSRIPEAFGRTFVEAMSHGIPVIASNIGAAPWTVGAAGVFFKKGNVRELRDAMYTLLTDEPLRRNLGAAGVKRAHAFQKEIVGPQLKKVLEEIANMPHTI